MAENDKKLVQACLVGQRNAQQELYERYKSKMFGVCLRYARNREAAEDLLLEGFMKVFRDLGQFQFNGSLEGWIRKVMVNTALMHLRKKYQFEFQSIDNDLVIEGLEVEPSVLENIRLDAIIQLIQQLPIGYQTIFNLYAIEGFSHKEIAEKLAIQESTSRSQYTRARRMLQVFLLEEKVL